MDTLTINPLTEHVGAEVIGVDVDRLLNDEALPGQINELLEERGVLVFPKLSPDPESQLAICHRLGEVDMGQGIMIVSLDEAKTHQAIHLRAAFMWHMDGVTLREGQHPQKATFLTAVALSDEGGETEFASTYAAYDALTDEEKERFENLRVIHNLSVIERRVTENPTPEQEEAWSKCWDREHPLVWTRRSGRKSLLAPMSADYIVGMDRAEGRALLEDLTRRSTTPDRVYRHHWSVGDTVLWDNRGALHRVEPYAADSGREMIRTTFVGDEAIQ